MPFIESTSGTPVLAAFSGFTDITASLSAAVNLSATVVGKTTIVADLEGGYPLTRFEGSTAITASLSTPIVETIIFAGSTSIEAPLTIEHYDPYELRFVIDILPVDSTPVDQHPIWLPRLKVDGQEIGIVSASYQEPSRSAGAQASIVLANPNDIDLILAGSDMEFGLGKQIAGAWDEPTFETFFSSGQTDSKEISIGWQNNGTTDTVNISIGSDLEQRLQTTPERDLVLYDSARQALSTNDFEVLYDTEGRAYLTELLAVPGMMLYDVFQKILVTRCGFSGYKTNLPNFPVARVDCAMGQGYMPSIGGIFGFFRPEIFADGNIVCIEDASIAMPAGFPAPREVAISDYRQLSVTDTKAKLDGLIVHYTEDKRNFDYTTSRTVTETETVGQLGDPGYTVTFIQRLYRDYYKSSQPGVVIRSELYHEERTTSGNVLSVGETREDYDFDDLGRFYGRSKVVYARVPDIATGIPALTLVSEEREDLIYAPHPFQPRSQYVAHRGLQVNGLIAIDGENQQLGQDFEREYLQAHRSGNLVESMTTRFGAIRTISETAEPKRDGQVTVKIVETDHLSNTVISDTKEDRAGDVSIYGTTPTQNRILVLDDENATRTTERIETLNVGELPLLYAIPLARRVLKNRKTKARTGRSDVIGYKKGLRKGMPVKLTGRDGDQYGNHLITGRSITANVGGVNMALEVTEI